VFDIIHFFRLGLERESPTTVSDIMRFAGAWEDMEDADGLEVELRERRQTAFASRCRDGYHESQHHHRRKMPI
jgi:hypothetical protein